MRRAGFSHTKGIFWVQPFLKGCIEPASQPVCKAFSLLEGVANEALLNEQPPFWVKPFS